MSLEQDLVNHPNARHEALTQLSTAVAGQPRPLSSP